LTLSVAPIKIAPNSPKGISWEIRLALLGSAILLVSLILLVDHPPINQRTDFSVTYIGSRMVYLRMGAGVYDLAEQEKLKKLLLPYAEPLIFEHPPFEALLLAPLGALPYGTAYFIWGLINAAIWLFLSYTLRPYLRAPRDDVAYFLLWLLFLPLWATLFEGQSSLVMFLLYSLTFIQLRKGRERWAGVVFGLALLKFQFAIPFVVILLLQRKWRFVQGFLATASVLGILSLVAVGWRGLIGYIHLISAAAANPESSSYGNSVGMSTVGGFVNSLLRGILGRAASSFLIASISIALLLLAARRWKIAGFASDARKFDLMFAAAIIVSLTTSLHMFTPDLSPLLLSMLIVASYFPGSGSPQLLVLGAALVMFWMPPLFYLLLARHWFYLWFPVLMLFLFGIWRLAELAPNGIAHSHDKTPAVGSL
jgi:hypothetical protein